MPGGLRPGPPRNDPDIDDTMDSFGPTRFESRRAMLLAGLRRRHAYEAAATGMAAQWREFQAMPEVPGRVGSGAYGVMCGHDATGLEYMCAVEVESFGGLPEGTGRMRVPGQHYAVFSHPAAGRLQTTWSRILAWLESGAYASANTPDFEVYPSGSGPQGTDGEIEIWIGVVPRPDSRA